MAERCASCGAILPEGAKLCTSCGKIVAKNTRLRTEPVIQRKPAPDVQTQSRVYSHKPTPTAVLDIVEDESRVRERPRANKSTAAHKKKKSASGKKAAKKSDNRVKFIIAFAALVIVLLLLLYLLIYMLKVREAKNFSYVPDSGIKMSYSTLGEASEHFFKDAKWDYSLFSGEVTVEGENKGTIYKYVIDDGKVICVYVGDQKLTDEKEIDILVQRMFL